MKGFLAVLLSFMALSATAQDQVKWEYKVVPKGNKTFEVKLTALLSKGWHIYSTTTPEGGPLPTKISFNKNPLATIQGGIKEIGKLEKKYEDVFDIDTKYFANRVEFVQVVRLKAAAKTALSGKIEFMVCNEQQCLPPTEETFSVILN
jgi:thiol:disulfide interchange protein DsbD